MVGDTVFGVISPDMLAVFLGKRNSLRATADNLCFTLTFSLSRPASYLTRRAFYQTALQLVVASSRKVSEAGDLLAY